MRKLALGALLLISLVQWLGLSAGQALPNCSFPAVYGFGDSLTDVGNAIAAFPEKFGHSEKIPYGAEFPMHPADRFTDGKLFIDFLGT